ncbi:hypothetical protein EAL2_808p03990 (plasmid) [Peptoclostridium acidaminophilum DSM 3953]|uniref:Glycoside hydrolase 123 catalytic domain-containing protein n=1 Tax=Peptoclostridium acidaminophilum DSM 3953 TaxID=1286171 RepID=W8TJD4_PEPAC|nr:DUF4091 domain-containing protein [Peptoclostridium acidaminophilum]AHM57903.1 hypothetical protein EAL2_808p03990 [Peptoclostridium acidaminophilum DSM 3953]
MKLDYKILDSSVKHIKGSEETIKSGDFYLEVAKEESFAFQIFIRADKPFFGTLGKNRDIHWKGLGDRIRIEIAGHEGLLDMSFLGYVQIDDGSIVADPILKKKSLYIESGYQMIWVQGKVPKGFSKANLELELRAYHSNGYRAEELVAKEDVNIGVLDYVIRPVKEGGFYLDLWQHLCSWARAYDVEYFSEEHFQIIDNYIKGLSELGQRVVDLIITDYPWAGQRCYQFEDNASNLYEFNIVKVSRKNGRLTCDFSAVDRYIDICFGHGIDEEINIFGIIGNWDAYSFGSPIGDLKDPMRVVCYDEDLGRFDYIRSKEEFGEYLRAVFRHLAGRGLWDKVKIMSDEPNNVELFKETLELIESAVPERKINIKCAIHDQHFFDNYGDNIQYLSLNTCELVNSMERLNSIKDEVNSRGGKMTWFSCCFPEDLNIFIKSPLIESRLNGWFTYYWDLDGFLRWAYAIWPTNPLKDVRYKYPKWNAGDMFFIYPGKDMKPMGSVREKNFLFGIQDFGIFKELEKSGISKTEIIREMERLLGSKCDMEFVPERSVRMKYSLEYKEYAELRNSLIKKHLLNSKL